MKFCFDTNGSVEIISLEGKLDVHTSPDFLERLENLIGNNRVNIVIDMGKLEFISSYGLGTITSCSKQATDKGGAIKLVNMKEKIKASFEVTGILEKFSLFETVEDAIKSFT